MVTRKKKVMDQDSITRSVTRLAHEILEKNDGPENLVIVGIQTRGEPLAERIINLIRSLTKVLIPSGSVDITFHRDDYRERLVVPQVKATNLPKELDDKTVILVDDVLFTGRTIRAAIEVLFSYGRPSEVHLAVLVDRGHREMPIRADYVGKNIPTHEGEHVMVQLKEVDGVDAVYLLKEES